MVENAQTLLKLSGLTKIYRRSHLGRTQLTVGTEDVSLEIARGEIFALLGLNGAGKTTTIKLILGLLKATRGEITFDGCKMPEQDAIRKTGYLPEIPYFPRTLSVSEILRFYGTLSSIPPHELDDRIAKVLETVKMTQNKDKKIRECSKGMLQRVSLAQVLIHDPEMLILDEPITGLDPLGLTEMRELILKLNAEGKTILFSSHMIAEVEKVAHRAGILVNGKLVRVMSADKWKDKPGELEKVFVQTVIETGGNLLG